MKTFLILAVILFMAADLFPQRSIIIHKNDGSGDETILTSKIDSITFFQCGVSQVSYAGKNYNTVQIGSQCWLKENLNVGTMLQGTQNSTNNGIIEKYCYNNDTNYCNTYGGLYQWAEIVQYKNGATNTSSPNPPFTGNVQGICPIGWHVPTLDELLTLKTTVNEDGNSLKTIGQGNGTNTTGFSALLAGHRNPNGFSNFGNDIVLYSSTEHNSAEANYLAVTLDNNIIWYWFTKIYGFSVRCIKN